MLGESFRLDLIIGPVGSGKTRLTESFRDERAVILRTGTVLRSAVGDAFFAKRADGNAPPELGGFVKSMLHHHATLSVELGYNWLVVDGWPRRPEQIDWFAYFRPLYCPVHVAVHVLRTEYTAWQCDMAGHRWAGKSGTAREAMDRERYGPSCTDAEDTEEELRGRISSWTPFYTFVEYAVNEPRINKIKDAVKR